MTKKRFLTATALLLGMAFAASAESATYHVGPGQPLARLGDVPWFSLAAGDTVFIHYQPTPYYEKILISGRGTPTNWIRVLGVPGPGGALPVISGRNATTSTNMKYRWQDATGGSAIQWFGVVQVAVRASINGDVPPIPGYIEIANLQIQDGYTDYQFTTENGTTVTYSKFAACIYARSPQHIVVRDSVLTNCGQGFYNWTGGGATNGYWEALAQDIVLQRNYFYNNGAVNSYTEHQSYTESDGVKIEYNRFGPMRSGALGSQVKDRSAGSIVRYNYIENSKGWMLDLVEPQEGYLSLGARATYLQTFVYGNALVNRGGSSIVHWNEDGQAGVGRASVAGGRLFFYNNTVLVVADNTDMYKLSLFNTNYGAYDCPPNALPGIIDLRNNVFAVVPRTPNGTIPTVTLAFCSTQNFSLGVNWLTPGWTLGTNGAVSGLSNLITRSASTLSLSDPLSGDVHLGPGSGAIGAGGSLAPEVASNSLGVNLSPSEQYVYHRLGAPRSLNAPVDLGAFSYPTVTQAAVAPKPPANPRIVR